MVGFSGGIDGGSTRTVRSAFLIVAFVMLGALLPATAVDAAVDAGTVVVSPDSGLVDGSVVTVSTIGATPATLVVTSLCPVGADPEIDGCDRWLSVEMTDETGSGSWQAVLDPILPQADGTVVDCRHVPCELVVSAWDTEDAAGAVVRVPRLQRLMRHICREGFEHHVAMCAAPVAGILAEAFGTYLGWDVYHHNAPED